MKIPGSVPLNQHSGSRTPGIQENSQMDNAAKGMEKIFLKHLINELRKSDDRTDILGNSKKDGFFESELYDQYVQLAVDRGDFGLAKMIKSQIEKYQNGGRMK